MNKNQKDMNREELEFAIFCIERVAAHLKINPKQVYLAWTEKSNLLQDYIVKNYDILHTQGKEYLVEDILEVMQKEGVAL